MLPGPSRNKNYVGIRILFMVGLLQVVIQTQKALAHGNFDIFAPSSIVLAVLAIEVATCISADSDRLGYRMLDESRKQTHIMQHGSLDGYESDYDFGPRPRSQFAELIFPTVQARHDAPGENR